jgi:hypothetical protein
MQVSSSKRVLNYFDHSESFVFKSALSPLKLSFQTMCVYF